MSKESAATFCNTVAADPGLYSEVVALSEQDGSTRSVPAERLVDLGARRGLIFTAEEFCDVWAERQAARAHELDDAELDAVAGGAGKPTPARRGGSGLDFELSDDFAP
jgi:hypothetical protein